MTTAPRKSENHYRMIAKKCAQDCHRGGSSRLEAVDAIFLCNPERHHLPGYARYLKRLIASTASWETNFKAAAISRPARARREAFAPSGLGPTTAS